MKYLFFLLPFFCRAQAPDFIYAENFFRVPMEDNCQCKFTIPEGTDENVAHTAPFYRQIYNPNKVLSMVLRREDGSSEMFFIHYLTTPDLILYKGFIYERDHYTQTMNIFATPIFYKSDQALEFACGFYRKIGKKEIRIDFIKKLDLDRS